MIFRFTVLAVTTLLMAQFASADTCADRDLTQSRLNIAQDLHAALMAAGDAAPMKREKLVELRDTEKSCAGRNSFNYLLAFLDVQYGSLQQGIDAIGVILATDAPDFEKDRMMSRLINRFVTEGHIDTAIDLTAFAANALPDEEVHYLRDRALLLAGKGRFDEARALIDADFETCLDGTVPAKIPSAVWTRLAIAEVSGDAEDERKVLARVSEAFGQAGEDLVMRDRISMTYEMLIGRRYDPAYSPQPIIVPAPRYPKAMARARKSGSCEVRFDLTEEGIPFDLTADCNEEGFAAESLRAVSEVRFEPLVIGGIPRRYFNVVYPLEYHIR